MPRKKEDLMARKKALLAYASNAQTDAADVCRLRIPSDADQLA